MRVSNLFVTVKNRVLVINSAGKSFLSNNWKSISSKSWSVKRRCI